MDAFNLTNSTISISPHSTDTPQANILLSGLVVTLIYAGTHCLLVMVLAAVIQYKEIIDDNKLSVRKLMKRVWDLRGVFTPLIVHIYDTATGTAIVILLTLFAYDS